MMTDLYYELVDDADGIVSKLHITKWTFLNTDLAVRSARLSGPC